MAWDLGDVVGYVHVYTSLWGSSAYRGLLLDDVKFIIDSIHMYTSLLVFFSTTRPVCISKDVIDSVHMYASLPGWHCASIER